MWFIETLGGGCERVCFQVAATSEGLEHPPLAIVEGSERWSSQRSTHLYKALQASQLNDGILSGSAPITALVARPCADAGDGFAAWMDAALPRRAQGV